MLPNIGALKRKEDEMKKKKYTCSCEYYYIRELLQKFTEIIKKVLNIIADFEKIPEAVPRTRSPWGRGRCGGGG